jgi:hypothetical protein
LLSSRPARLLGRLALLAFISTRYGQKESIRGRKSAEGRGDEVVQLSDSIFIFVANIVLQAKDAEEVYDVVEDERVNKRLRQDHDDFVEDDDGQGYAYGDDYEDDYDQYSEDEAPSKGKETITLPHVC